jgi:hypothetical protein
MALAFAILAAILAVLAAIAWARGEKFARWSTG